MQGGKTEAAREEAANHAARTEKLQQAANARSLLFLRQREGNKPGSPASTGALPA